MGARQKSKSKMGFKLKLIFLLFVVKNVVGSEMREAGYENEEPLLYEKFPEGFTWGVATASYQVSPL